MRLLDYLDRHQDLIVIVGCSIAGAAVVAILRIWG